MGQLFRAVIAALWLLPGMAAAQEEVAVSPGWQEKLRPYCRSVEHRPRADVEYKPGRAAGGWEVASPDVNEPLNFDPSQLRIPLYVPLENYVQNPGAYNAPVRGNAVAVGTLSMQDGQMFLDGMPVDRNSGEIRSLCNKVMR